MDASRLREVIYGSDKVYGGNSESKDSLPFQLRLERTEGRRIRRQRQRLDAERGERIDDFDQEQEEKRGISLQAVHEKHQIGFFMPYRGPGFTACQIFQLLGVPPQLPPFFPLFLPFSSSSSIDSLPLRNPYPSLLLFVSSSFRFSFASLLHPHPFAYLSQCPTQGHKAGQTPTFLRISALNSWGRVRTGVG
eukprot:764141-Hanusia_phi.AAC.6